MNNFAILNYLLLYFLFTSVVNGICLRESREIHKPLILKVYTHNIRYETTRLDPNELSWNKRKSGVISSMIAESTNVSTIFTLQEVKHNQLMDIKNEMTPKTWAHVGEGRDGGNSGEYNPILYNTDEWDLLSNYTKWLSESPEKPSAYLNKCHNRIVTIGTFRHKLTGSVVNVLNTHFCHKYEDSKEFQAHEILKHVDALGKMAPTIVAGDFNSERSSIAYKKITSSLNDHGNHDELPTDTGFSPHDKQATIDYIFSKGLMKSVSHSVKENILYEGYRFSDHRPVIEVFLIELSENFLGHLMEFFQSFL